MPNYEENAKIVKVQYEERRSLQPLGAIFQYDTGHYLELADFPNLPDYFEVQFSLDPYGKTTPQVGHECVVKIPDELVRKGTEIYAWLWVVSEKLGLTKCQIIIPVIPRGKVPCSCPTPEQGSAIDQAIIALNDELARLEQAAKAAEEARKAAEAAAEQALIGAGCMEMEIVDGYLIYRKKDTIGTDFYLKDGYLFVTISTCVADKIAEIREDISELQEAIPDPESAIVGDYLRIGDEGNPQWKEGGGSVDVGIVDECLILD